MTAITIDELRQILAECAGEDESVHLSGDVLDKPLEDLGYDSRALMEAAAVIKRRFGAEMPDEAIAVFRTPRMIIDAVNNGLNGTA